MWSFVGKIVDRGFAVGGAFLFCQLPLLMQQYSMVLSGHLAESRRQINMLQHAASLTNKTLQEYIAKFLKQPDVDFVHQGELMQAMQLRYEDLQQAYTALSSATVWSKPFVFVKHLDTDVFFDTLYDFTPGLSLTFESFVYAVIGAGFGVMLYRFSSSFLRSCASTVLSTRS